MLWAQHFWRLGSRLCFTKSGVKQQHLHFSPSDLLRKGVLMAYWTGSILFRSYIAIDQNDPDTGILVNGLFAFRGRIRFVHPNSSICRTFFLRMEYIHYLFYTKRAHVERVNRLQKTG